MVVVLIPGFPDFPELLPRPLQLPYFVGVPKLLQELGFEVFKPELGTLDPAPSRAEQVEHFLTHGPLKDDRRKLHIIAHSAGGVTARLLVSPNGRNLGSRVQSITTIGTPHEGTPIATFFSNIDDFTHLLRPAALDTARRFDRKLRQSIAELTDDGMRIFNQKIKDAQGVAYFSYGGKASRWRLWHTFFAPFQPLFRSSGDHDGWVPLKSTRHGRFHAEHADHAQLIGWNLSPQVRGRLLPFVSKYDHLDLYRRIANNLRQLSL